MLQIAICDDDELFSARLSQQIEVFFQSNNIVSKSVLYGSGEEILADVNAKHDIIFLDIQMGKLGGLEVADLLRGRDQQFTLVYVSASSDFARFGYERNAFRYLVKEELDYTLAPCLEALLHKQELDKLNMTFPFKNMAPKTIALQEILYLESIGHKVIFHLKHSCGNEAPHLYRHRLDALELSFAFSGLFLRIHKSYLVNMCSISSLVNNQAYLKNGAVLPASSKRYSQALRTYLEFKGKNVT